MHRGGRGGQYHSYIAELMHTKTDLRTHKTIVKLVFCLLLSIPTTCRTAAASAPQEPPPSLQQSLTAAFTHHQNHNFVSASLHYDRALLTIHGNLRPDLPLQIVTVLQSAGRCHFKIPTPHHLERALLFFHAAKQRTTPDLRVVNRALVDIYTRLGQFANAEQLVQEIAASRHNHPEDVYDQALWLSTHYLATTGTTGTLATALQLFQRAAETMQASQTPPLTVHTGLSNPFYLWGLVLHEWGNTVVKQQQQQWGSTVVTRQQQQEQHLQQQHFVHRNVYQKYGSQLWESSHRRYLIPHDHPEFASVPLVEPSNTELYPRSDVLFLKQHFATIQNEVVQHMRHTQQEQQQQQQQQQQGGEDAYTADNEKLHNSARGGNWTMLRITHAGAINPTICKLLPKTCELLQQMPSLKECFATKSCQDLSMYISRMAPGTHVLPHCGPTWKRLRLHLALQVPDKCCWLELLKLQGGGGGGGDDVSTYQQVHWQEGEVIVFDDSFEHSVHWDQGKEDRIVLIVDVYHPRYVEGTVGRVDL